MKGMWLRIVIGVLVVALIALMASQMSFKEEKVRMPLHGEAARNPFYAAILLSQELGSQAAWERVFTTPPADSVIYLSTWNWTLSRARRERIEHWVEGGGRLVVDSSLVGVSDEFERWSGIGELKEKKKAKKKAGEESADDEATDEAPADEQTSDEEGGAADAEAQSAEGDQAEASDDE